MKLSLLERKQLSGCIQTIKKRPFVGYEPVFLGVLVGSTNIMDFVNRNGCVIKRGWVDVENHKVVANYASIHKNILFVYAPSYIPEGTTLSVYNGDLVLAVMNEIDSDSEKTEKEFDNKKEK